MLEGQTTYLRLFLIVSSDAEKATEKEVLDFKLYKYSNVRLKNDSTVGY